MDVVLDRSALVRALSLACQVSNRRATMPILANVLLRATGDKVLVAASDLTSTVSTEIDAKVKDGGSLALNAKHLYEMVKSFSLDEVHLRSLDGNNAELKCGKTKLKLPGLAVRDFPKLPDHREVQMTTVGAAVLREMFERTEFAITSDEQRPNLFGLHFECDGTVAMACAGHVAGMAWIVRRFAYPKTESVLIPRSAVHDLQAAIAEAENCDLYLSKTQIFVRAANAILAVTPLGASWPVQILKGSLDTSECAHIAVLPRKAFVAALERAAIVCRSSGGIQVEFKPGALAITTESMSNGVSEDEISITYDGPSFSIVAAAGHWLSHLKPLSGDEMEMACQGASDPIRFRAVDDDTFKTVVMPQSKVG